MKRILTFAVPMLMTLAFTRPDAHAWDIDNICRAPAHIETDTSWHDDILHGYEARHVDQGQQFDGPCRSTIIRKKQQPGTNRGVLFVHGFNDYFFQSEMGERIADSGYRFYAVDLRRYGRSRLPWQYPFNIRDLRKYYADIDSGIAQMRRDGVEDITLLGHSTGGLTVISYGTDRGAEITVDRIATDSPFLAWNFNFLYRHVLIPGVRNLSVVFKNAKVKQAHCDGYAYSLLKNHYGEWTYDTDWKMIYSPPVTFSWTGAIQSAQNRVKKHGDRLAVPLLVMHSSHKVEGCGYTDEFMRGDAVLDPHMIRDVAQTIKKKSHNPVWICTIDSGIHNLILSRQPQREAAYDTLFRFFKSHKR